MSAPDAHSDCRLIIDAPRGGAWNMAVDQVLLESAAKTGRATLRFYGWSEPTLSLGYFQTHDDRARHEDSLDCPVVRRFTGGGAILHDCELTYSFAWRPPTGATTGGHQKINFGWLSTLFHETLREVLAAAGVPAVALRTSAQRLVTDQEPFLCFQRRSVGDLLVGDAKCAGSAQRRRGDCVLQHGSVLLATSQKAPELTGLVELTGMPFTARDLLSRWPPRLAERLRLDLAATPLLEQEKRRASQLALEKYGCDDWVKRR